MLRRLIKFIVLSCFILGLLLFSGGLIAGTYFYIRLTRDLPKISRLEDYNPQAVTTILAADGQTVLAELYEKRRYPVSIEKIPLLVQHAFLAAEDANFYQHPGIDVVSILRAIVVNFRTGKTKQGASTITQQVVKSLLLSSEKTYKRKAREAILAYRLEKFLSKQEILEIYLNEIFLGQSAYGVKAAAKVHFHKRLDELTVAEAAYLAALPKSPSYLTRPSHRRQAIERQHYVMGQMEHNGFISAVQHAAALKEELKIYPPDHTVFFEAPYCTSYAVGILKEKLKSVDKYLTATNPGGLTVETTCDVNANRLAVRAVQHGLREVDKRRGWRGPLKHLKRSEVKGFLTKIDQRIGGQLEAGHIYPAIVKSVSRKRKMLKIQVGVFSGIVTKESLKWAWRHLGEHEQAFDYDPLRFIKVGSVIEVALDKSMLKQAPITKPTEIVKFVLEETPELQAAFAVQNVLTGEIKAIVGGYDYKSSVFNRATQGLLQPGSAFKPFIYLAALDRLHYTPATIVPDSPIRMVDGTGKVWAPQNYDHKFIGPITLRTALQRSRNVVSVYLLKRLGVQTGIEFAKRLGITTHIAPNMSIALGTAEVKLIEMVRAYSAFAGGGLLPDSLIIRQVKDRNGEVIYQQYPKAVPVINEDEAFIMANMMKGVVERGTAQRVKVLGRPVAGKTGTTNDQMDAWFIGYTPEWVAGAWVGFDVKKQIGRYETGGKAAAPIFIYFMKEFLKDEPILDFEIPDGVIPVRINPVTGRLAEDSGFLEYFISGTEPTTTSEDIDIPQDYLHNDEF